MEGIQATQPTLPDDVAFWLYIAGGAAALLGSFGVGQRIGRQRENETLRVRLGTAFRGTARLYTRLGVLQDDLYAVSRSIVTQAASANSETVPLSSVTHGFDVVAVRLSEQIAGYDDALDEWHGLVPDEVDRIRNRPDTANSQFLVADTAHGRGGDYLGKEDRRA
jgi:hypothetical protein